MTKSEFIVALKAAQPEIFPTKAAAERAYTAFCDILAKAAISEEGVRLPKVGSFAVVDRAARTGRNPRTGKSIKIPARRGIKFSPSQSLNDSIAQ